MHLILLPGNSKHNKDWIERVEKTLSPLFDSTTIQYYEHWLGKSPKIDIQKELEKLKVTVKKYDSYAVFAKSAGALITLIALSKKLINPSFCFFIGIPISWAKQHDIIIEDWLRGHKTKKLFIQHTNDPYAPSKKLENILKVIGARNYKLIQVPGNDHDYEDIDFLKMNIKKWIIK